MFEHRDRIPGDRGMGRLSEKLPETLASMKETQWQN